MIGALNTKLKKKKKGKVNECYKSIDFGNKFRKIFMKKKESNWFFYYVFLYFIRK